MKNNNMRSEVQYLTNLIQNNPMMNNLFSSYLTNPESFQQQMNSQSNYLYSLLYGFTNNCHMEYLQSNDNTNVPYNNGEVTLV